MIPVEQTRLGYPNGNCFNACIASVLERPLEEIPDLMLGTDGKGKGWWPLYQQWFREQGFEATAYLYDDIWFPRGYSLMSAQSPRGDFLHSVVCLDGNVVWDPHPQREMGLGQPADWTILKPLAA